MYIAEYLPRLNSISVKVDFPDDVSTIKGIGVTDGDLHISGNDVVVCRLPLPVLKEIKLTGISKKDNVLVVTVQTPPQPAKENSFMDLVDSSVHLWSVADLLAKTPQTNNVNQFKFTCGCGTTLVDSTTSSFRDMPLELWYEMMDFWHCHKPHSHDHPDEKNYNELRPKHGEVILGLSYMMVGDLLTIRKNGETLACAKCSKEVGSVVNGTNRIHKWQVHLEYDQRRESYAPYLHVHQLMCEKINSAAARKFVVTSGDKRVFIWVVSVGLAVATASKTLTNCMKVVYGDSDADDVSETLDVPASVFADLMAALTSSNDDLPEALRAQSGLRVGYL